MGGSCNTEVSLYTGFGKDSLFLCVVFVHVSYIGLYCRVLSRTLNLEWKLLGGGETKLKVKYT